MVLCLLIGVLLLCLLFWLSWFLVSCLIVVSSEAFYFELLLFELLLACGWVLFWFDCLLYLFDCYCLFGVTARLGNLWCV